MTRTFEARWRAMAPPPGLDAGSNAIGLGHFFRYVTRAQDPNVPGLALGRRVPGYAAWPYFRYAPMIASQPRLALSDWAGELDARKKGIVAEDFGLGFAMLACMRLGVMGLLTKWEFAQTARYEALEKRLVDLGISGAKDVRKAAEALGNGLRGVDFVGYAPSSDKWVLCESKGSMGAPATDKAILAAHEKWIAAATALPEKISDVPAGIEHGLVQAVSTDRRLRGAGISNTIKLVAATWLAQEPDQSSVDYVDPDVERFVDGELGIALTELVLEGHYDWIAGFLGVPGGLWAGRTVDGNSSRANLLGDVAFAREVVIPLGPDRSWRLRVGLDPSLVPHLLAGDIEALRRYRPGGNADQDGFVVTSLSDPDEFDGPGDADAGPRRPAGTLVTR